jgi:hypothetical protein
MTLMLISGALGKTIHEKKPEKKSHDTVPSIMRALDACTHSMVQCRSQGHHTYKIYWEKN